MIVQYAHYRNKSYLVLGNYELQYGHVSHSIAVFRRTRWKRLFALDLHA